MEIMGTIVDGLVDGLVGIGEGIGGALSSMAESIFVTTAEGGAQTLTTFGGLVVVFAGISLGFSLTRSFNQRVKKGCALRAPFLLVGC